MTVPEPVPIGRRPPEGRAAAATLLAVALSVSFLACDGVTGFERDGSALVQTSALEYTLRETGDGRALEAAIPFRYENRTAATVCLTNCNGAYAVALVDESGEVAWSPVLPQCLSPAITIEPGETLRDTLEVVHGLEPNLFPKFEGDPEGIFRLDLVAASRGGAGPSCGGERLPEDERTSNRFELERE